jgi:ribonucleoside-diphosphate reductase alpha chain
MRFEPSGMTNDADIRIAKSIVDYVFRWFGKKFLITDQQEAAGILSPEVKARLASQYASESDGSAEPAEASPPGQTPCSTHGKTRSNASLSESRGRLAESLPPSTVLSTHCARRAQPRPGCRPREGGLPR